MYGQYQYCFLISYFPISWFRYFLETIILV